MFRETFNQLIWTFKAFHFDKWKKSWTNLVIFEPNSVAHVSVGLNVIVLIEYSRLNISSAIVLRRLFKMVNLHNSTAGRRRRISSMQSSFRSLKPVFGFLVTRFEVLWPALVLDDDFLVRVKRSFRLWYAVFLLFDLVRILIYFFDPPPHTTTMSTFNFQFTQLN